MKPAGRLWVMVLSIASMIAMINWANWSNDDDVFAGMWHYDPDKGSDNARGEGILLIEGQCVYVIDDYGWLFPSTRLEELPDPVRIVVKLPRYQTRYDPFTGSIWVNGDGPMINGDRVQLGGAPLNIFLDACSNEATKAFTAASMARKSCDPRWSPEHPSQTGCKST